MINPCFDRGLTGTISKAEFHAFFKKTVDEHFGFLAQKWRDREVRKKQEEEDMVSRERSR